MGILLRGDGDNDTVLASLGVFEAGIAGVDLDKDMEMKVLTRGRLSTSLKDINFDKKKEKLVYWRSKFVGDRSCSMSKMPFFGSL
jgi:hypothetical protein